MDTKMQINRPTQTQSLQNLTKPYLFSKYLKKHTTTVSGGELSSAGMQMWQWIKYPNPKLNLNLIQSY